jgi:hypothetical protein
MKCQYTHTKVLFVKTKSILVGEDEKETNKKMKCRYTHTKILFVKTKSTLVGVVNAAYMKVSSYSIVKYHSLGIIY